ncbi:MAG: stage II sporulation protein M [Spirochaetaceae bacterium]|nr:stage II sporulation protein M [Spirochaetaceae bacterium]
MTQQHFVGARQPFWNKVEECIRGGNKAIRSCSSWFPQAFRELTQDLNTARAHGFDPAIIERLNRLVLEGNQILYGQRSFSPKAFIDFLVYRFPRAVRSHWKGIAAAHLLFYVFGFAVFLLCVRKGEFAYIILGEDQAWQFESMYNPDSSHFLNPRDVSSDADMFGYYIYNNISIAFRTFAGGIIAGVGSLFFLIFNAVFLGAAAGHIVNKNFGESFLSFIIGHSSFELSAIVLSAFAGLYLGYRLFVTQGFTRAASLKRAGKTAVPIIGGSALLLVIAAAIEAFWSSRHNIPVMVKYAAGTANWILLFAYFVFSGRKENRG